MNLKNHKFLIKRKFTILSLIVVIFAGLLCKQNSLAFHHWISDHLAGLFYEVFWILFLFLFFSAKIRITHIPIFVFIFTLVIEFVQLWHPFFLEIIRQTWPGKIILGTTFSPWDFPFYIIGCFLGWQLILKLEALER
ncbi:MAG: DUF2809 domain-containing protein [Anaerolineales bacterium]